MEGIEAAGYTPGEEIAIALDPATSEIEKDGSTCSSTRAASSPPSEMAGYWAEMAGALPDRLDRGRDGRGGLGRLEDAHRALGDTVQLVGDDLFVTNTERLQQGIERGVGNSILVKVNQIGTLTETLDAMETAEGPATRR